MGSGSKRLDRSALEGTDFAIGSVFTATALHRQITSVIAADLSQQLRWRVAIVGERFARGGCQVPPQLVLDIKDLELAIPERRSLLSTSALQGSSNRLSQPKSEPDDSRWDHESPGRFSSQQPAPTRVNCFSTSNSSKKGYRLWETPLVETTIDAGFVTVTTLDAVSEAWQNVPTTTTYQPSRLTIEMSTLAEGSYRLLISRSSCDSNRRQEAATVTSLRFHRDLQAQV